MKGAEPGLPVDPARLRQEFPAVSEGELAAYVTITRRVMAETRSRAETMRQVMQEARRARAKADGGEALSEDEALLLRYLGAVEKMQASTIHRA